MRNTPFFASRRRHTRLQGDWSSDVCSSDLLAGKFLWRWEEARTWDAKQRKIVWGVSWLIFAGTFAPGLVSQYKREYNSHVQFKEAPELDWWYRFLVRRSYARIQDYLREIDVPVPADTPPVAIKHGPPNSLKTEISVPPNLPLYRGDDLLPDFRTRLSMIS